MTRQPVIGGLLLFAACASPAAPPPSALPARSQALPILDDDYARALAEARATQRPIVAVTGATWCDSCREMRAIVLADPRLAPLARDFVWLAIDVERSENAGFVARFASEGQPVTWVIDAKTERAALGWRGTPSPELLEILLHRASDAIHGRDPGGDAAAALVRAFRADAAGETKRALDEYRYVLAHAALGPDRATAVVAMTALLAATDDRAACAETAAREVATMAPGDAKASLLALGLGCDDTSAPLIDAARTAVSNADARALASDRSALFEHIVRADRRRNDADAVARDGRAWVAFLEASSHAARSPAARASLDGARVAAHVALREPEAAIPALAQSERDLPRDGGPPAHLARAFVAAERWGDALRAIDRALALAYGPYRLVLLGRKVEIEIGNGDAHAALRTLDDALTLARALPLSGAYARVRATLEIRRSEWRAR